MYMFDYSVIAERVAPTTEAKVCRPLNRPRDRNVCHSRAGGFNKWARQIGAIKLDLTVPRMRVVGR
jgi:hypothetical protein